MSRSKTSHTSEPPLHANKDMLIDIDSATVRYGGETVLDRVSFCVHRGEFVGILGPNGAGKTTLLKVMLGLLEPTSGKASKHRARIGYIPQRAGQYNAIVPISVLEVVRLGSGGSRQAALKALEMVKLTATASKRFSELSGGQQQRVAIAKALAADADILILDEPTTGIDERSQAEFYALLRSLQAGGLTIIMVSHEVDTVLKLVTRVVCLNRGVLYDGAPEHFEADKYLPAAYKAQHMQLHHHHEAAHA